MIMTARTRSTDGIDGKDAVGLYLDAIAKTPLLSAEEEVQLARAIEAGLFAQEILDGNETTSTDATREELEQLVELGEQAMQRFIKANLRLVVSVARKYGRAQMPLLDLVQEGNTGLIRAVEKFDYTKGFKFSTYATRPFPAASPSRAVSCASPCTWPNRSTRSPRYAATWSAPSAANRRWVRSPTS